MTEDDRDGADGADPRTDDAGLKDRDGTADEPDVLDGISGQPRLTWDSVTDAGGAPAEVGEETEKSSFQFDLGGALARLGSDEPEPSSEAPTRAPSPTTETRPAAAPTDQPKVAPAPEIDDAGTAEPAMHTRPEPPAHSSPPDERAGATPSQLADDAVFVASEPLPSRAEPVVESEPLASRAEPTVAPDPLPTRAEPTVAPDPLPTRAEPTAAPEPLPTRAEPDVQSLPARSDHRIEPVSPDPAGDVTTQYPRRVPGTHLESQMREAEHAVPQIDEATPVDASPRPTARQSVFDDGDPGAVAVRGAPTLPGGPNPPPNALPSLPASNPAAPPAVVDAIGSAPSTPDINALRSAQLRASKQQRTGKLFGRSLLAFVVIGGLLAAALLFGRSLLFDTSWDAELTPIVNDVEAARGAEFDDTVPLETVSATEMGERLRATTIGDGWVDQVPAWRALGLATGSVTAESVGAALASSTVAIYDPDDNRIYLTEGGDLADAAPDLRVALERAFDAQNGMTFSADVRESGTGMGFVGVSSSESIATRAVDELIAAGGAVSARQPADETLPVPIAYELAAVDVLGEPILASAGLTAADVPVGGPYPDAVRFALDDAPGTAASVLIEPGEVSIAPPVALGNDDWSLVWGTRLPETAVDRLVQQVTADSYRPVDRNGTVCVVAVFQAGNDADGAEVFASMLSWAAGAPAASQPVVTQLSPTRVQLDVCDPGAEGGAAPNIGVVDALIDRQQLRLTN